MSEIGPELPHYLSRGWRVASAVSALCAMTLATAPSVENPSLTQNTDKLMEDDGDIRVATMNVRGWLSIDEKSNTSQFIRFLDEFAPDIGCGVEGILNNGKFPDDELAERGYSVVKAPTRNIPLIDNGSYGNFLISKSKIKSFNVLPLHDSADLSDIQRFFRPRNFVHVELEVDNGSIFDVVVFHAEGAGEIDKDHVNQLLKYIASELTDKPVLICGDANNELLYQELEGASDVPNVDRNDLKTFPADNPRRVLDVIRIINTGDEVYVIEYGTADADSDHLFLTAIIEKVMINLSDHRHIFIR